MVDKVGFGALRPVEELSAAEPAGRPTVDFETHVQGALEEVSGLQAQADRAVEDLVVDNAGSIHEAMLAMRQAEIGFKLMLTVRNKLVDAYQEIIRMQI